MRPQIKTSDACLSVKHYGVAHEKENSEPRRGNGAQWGKDAERKGKQSKKTEQREKRDSH